MSVQRENFNWKTASEKARIDNKIKDKSTAFAPLALLKRVWMKEERDNTWKKKKIFKVRGREKMSRVA